MRHDSPLPKRILAACQAGWIGVSLLVNAGCFSGLASHPPRESLKEPIGFGRIIVWQDKPSGRIFLPELASFEFTSNDGTSRYRMHIESASSYFFLSLRPGSYRVTRVIIQEGGFRSSAEVPIVFNIPEKGVVYLGDWRFHPDPPNFTRELEVAISSEPVKAMVELKLQYPSLLSEELVSTLATPSMVRARLFEITPYPRFRWFHRHNPT